MVNSPISGTNRNNFKGENGVIVAIAFHPQWLDEQKQRGSKVKLIDIFSDTLKFCAENNDGLHKLSLDDLRKAVLP